MKTLTATILILAVINWCGAARADDERPLEASTAGPELEVDTDLPVGPLLLGSFGLVLVGVGAGFGWQAKQEHDNWQEARDSGDPMGEMDGLADDVKAHSITANVLMFSGAGLAAISLIWWLAGGDDDEEGGGEGEIATARWTPLFEPGQAAVVVQF